MRLYFPVSRGLVDEPKHAERIGPALWTYLWLLRHQTSNTGEVRGGRRVAASEVGAALGLSTTAVREHLARLAAHGYIRLEGETGAAPAITIQNPMPVWTKGRRANPAEKRGGVSGKARGGSGIPRGPIMNAHAEHPLEAQQEEQ